MSTSRNFSLLITNIIIVYLSFFINEKKTRENDVKCPLRNGTFFDMPTTFNIYIQIELEIMLLYIQIFLKKLCATSSFSECFI